MIFKAYKRATIISLNVHSLSFAEAMNGIISLAKEKISSRVCFANAHMVIEGYRDETFANQVNASTFVMADGMPLVKCMRYFYGLKQDRIAGMDVMPELLKLAGQNGISVYFFGTTDDLLTRMKLKVQQDFPSTVVAGSCAPPFSKSLDDADYINQINESGAGLVFVALGCPKQEKWMAKHSEKINAVILGVGGAFPVYAGVTSRAPLFLQKSSLEWVYRLFQEPTRLFRRYFITNSLFVYLALKFKVQLFFSKTRKTY